MGVLAAVYALAVVTATAAALGWLRAGRSEAEALDLKLGGLYWVPAALLTLTGTAALTAGALMALGELVVEPGDPAWVPLIPLGMGSLHCLGAVGIVRHTRRRPDELEDDGDDTE